MPDNTHALSRPAPTKEAAFLPLVAVLVTFTLLLILASPVTGLEIDKYDVDGQVKDAETMHLGEDAYGVMLTIKPGVQEAPQSWLLITPDANAKNWTFIDIEGDPGTIAAGDMTGDGNDEIAVTHRLEGAPCPSPGPAGQVHCGIVRVYDGQALAQGTLEAVTEIIIQPEDHPCPPSIYPPAELDFKDITGDGHADLAMGQNGLHEDSCGVAHVMLGVYLSTSSTATIDEACAKVRGPQTQSDEEPSLFASKLSLFTPALDPTRGTLAVGAPKASHESMLNAGQLTVYDISNACPNNQGTTQTPPVLTTVGGETANGVFSYSLAHHHDTLFVGSAREPLRMLNATTLEEKQSENPLPSTRPVKVTQDMTGDGEPQLMVGPYVYTLDGELVYHFQPFAHQNFRSAVVSPDHVIMSDKFGQRLWSISDLDRPHLVLYPSELDQVDGVHPGDLVNVTVAQIISTIPNPFPLEWHASGARVVDYTDTWIHLVPDEPGTITVQAKLSNATTTYRLPVHPVSGTYAVEGPTEALPGTNVTLEASTPPNATVAWTAPDGTPSTTGNGSTFQVAFGSPGTYSVEANITDPDQDNATVIEHIVNVQEATLTIDAPDAIPQGQRLTLTVEDAPDGSDLHWHVDHEAMGPLNLQGSAVRLPTAGSGPLTVTVTAHGEDGDELGTGYATVMIENQPPKIVSSSIDAAFVESLEGEVKVDDPGGDVLHIEWFLDGEPVGEGTSLSVGGLEEGPANVTIVATDEGGLSTAKTRPVTIESFFTVEEGVEPGPNTGAKGHVEEGENGILPVAIPPTILVLALVALTAVLARCRTR